MALINSPSHQMAMHLMHAVGLYPANAMRTYSSDQLHGVQWGRFSATAYTINHYYHASHGTHELHMEPELSNIRKVFTSDYWELFVYEMRNVIARKLDENYSSNSVDYVVAQGPPSTRRYYRINLYPQRVKHG